MRITDIAAQEAAADHPGPRTSASRPRPGRAPAMPPDERRAAIIDAATPLLRTYGRAVTTRRIADAAGIAEGTIFRVFPSKDALIDAVVEHVFDPTDSARRISAIDLADPLQSRLKTCIRIACDRVEMVVGLMTVLHRPEDGHEKRPRHRGGHRAFAQAHANLLAAVTAVLEPDATLLSCSPKRAAQLIHTLAFAGAHPMLEAADRFGADEITRILLHGILK